MTHRGLKSFPPESPFPFIPQILVNNMKVKERCPLVEMVNELGARLSDDFSCDECSLNPLFCRAYRTDEKLALEFQTFWKNLIDKYKDVDK